MCREVRGRALAVADRLGTQRPTPGFSLASSDVVEDAGLMTSDARLKPGVKRAR
jgi:hypothetical protein